jgi:hypothetical protein
VNICTQSRWYGADIFAQERDLQEFVNDHQITSIYYLGDCDRIRSLLGHDVKENCELCVMIYNRQFRFSEIVLECNRILPTLVPGGFLYLSVNKFLADPEPNLDNPEDYDLSILHYMLRHIPYPLIGYYSGRIDAGQRFNWVHPLTRFIYRYESP